MNLSGSIALVTGAGSGLGRSLALQLATECSTVWVTDQSEDGAEAVAAEIRANGGTARTRTLDVSSWQAWRETRDQVGQVDILVNNAGVANIGPLLASDEHEWDRQININLMGVVRGSRMFVPGMVERGSGQVLNIASMAGLLPASGMISYHTAKAAVVSFSEALRIEVALDGVGVSVCCPAFFRTNLTDSMEGTSPATVARIQKLMDQSPLTADDVARACIEAMERNELLVIPHRKLRPLWVLRRLFPTRYRKRLIAQERSRRAKRLARES